MTKIKSSWLFFVCMTVTSLAHASGNDGGKGGVAIVCRDPQTQVVRRARLLDLYALEEYPDFKGKIKIGYSSSDIDGQINNALSAFDFDPKLKIELSDLVNRVRSTSKPVENNKRLVPTRDESGFVIDGFDTNRNCQNDLENVVVFRPGSGGIWYDQAILDALLAESPTHVAALYVHEAAYQLSLRSKQKTSKPAQRMTGYVFSDIYQPELLKSMTKAFITLPTQYVVVDLNSDAPVALKIRWGNMGRHIIASNSPVGLPASCGGGEDCDVILGQVDELKTRVPAILLALGISAFNGAGARLEYDLEVSQGEDILRTFRVAQYQKADFARRTHELRFLPLDAFEFVFDDRI